MLNQTPEAAASTTYLENYLEAVEDLPDSIQIHLSQLRELDIKYQTIMKELDAHQNSLAKGSLDSFNRKRTILAIQKALIRAQEIGDDKLHLVQLIQDLIENKARQLEADHDNIVLSGRNMESPSDIKDFQPQLQSQHLPQQQQQQPERSSKRLRKQRVVEVSLYDGCGQLLKERGEQPRKHKKKKKKSSNTSSSVNKTIDKLEEQPIDPDEPTYCLCEQVSFGEMIGCDNESCAIEWFHFSCVGLFTKPKGKWYCPNCRGERSNQMKQTSSSSSKT